MPPSWGPKLEKKLRALADGASKESIQTLATWIAFNRKHATIIAQVFCDSLKSTLNNNNAAPTRQWLYWQIIHEVLLSKHKDPEKWDKLLDLRTTIGDAAVVPAIQELLLLGTSSSSSSSANVVATATKLEPLLSEWDEHNVFGGPTLVSKIRRMLSAPTTAVKDEEPQPQADKTKKSATTSSSTSTGTGTNVSTSTSAVSESTPKEDTVMTTTETQAAAPEVTTEEAKTASVESKLLSMAVVGLGQKRRSSLSSLQGDVEYDFDSKVRV
jgi:hypothetical protein